ncbi:MAG TPA: hypothetical protein VGC79_14010 [Polyangiaceae bacterium]
MSYATRARSLTAGLFLAAVLPACGSEATDSAGASLESSEPGWLVVDWTIAGAQDAEQCDLGQAATLAVTVGNGETERVYQDPCVTFNATITLAPGSYAARAELLDGAGTPLMAPISLPPFEIASGNPLRLQLEIPRSSFFGSLASR